MPKNAFLHRHPASCAADGVQMFAAQNSGVVLSRSTIRARRRSSGVRRRRRIRKHSVTAEKLVGRGLPPRVYCRGTARDASHVRRDQLCGASRCTLRSLPRRPTRWTTNADRCRIADADRSPLLANRSTLELEAFRARCRVAPAGFPAGALSRAGRGDFNHRMLATTYDGLCGGPGYGARCVQRQEVRPLRR